MPYRCRSLRHKTVEIIATWRHWTPSLCAALGALTSIAAHRRTVGVSSSGCWRYVHVEGEGFGVGVVVLGIALQSECDG